MDKSFSFPKEAIELLESKITWQSLLLPWLVGGLCILLLLWSWFSTVDIITPARGVIIPNTREIKIQSKEVNVIQSILVKEGEKVFAGQKLVTFIQADKQAEHKKTLQEQWKLTANIFRLQSFLSFLKNSKENIEVPKNNPFLKQEQQILQHQKQEMQAELNAAENQILSLQKKKQSLELEIQLNQQQQTFLQQKINRFQELQKQGLVKEEEVQDLNEKLFNLTQEKKIKYTNLAGLSAEIMATKNNKTSALQKYYQSTQKELLENQQIYKTLQLDLVRITKEISLRNLTATIDGIINKISIHTPGAVVQSGEEILSVIPLNSPLEVEANILNQDVGFLKESQKVFVKLDSFTFTKYGKITGKVVQIAQGGIEDPKLGMVYPVKIELEHDYIQIEKKHFQLRPGMTVTVDITTGQRKLIDFIIEPFLRYQDEALKER